MKVIKFDDLLNRRVYSVREGKEFPYKKALNDLISDITNEPRYEIIFCEDCKYCCKDKDKTFCGRLTYDGARAKFPVELKDYCSMAKEKKQISTICRVDDRQSLWVKSNPFTDTVECLKCGYNIPSEELQTPFCPWCGKEMLNWKEGENK